MPIARIAAIHDITGIGRCGLSAATPVLSALGHQVCPLPTALLSTHPAGFRDFHLHPLAADTTAVLAHWAREEIAFDAFYTGYLCAPTQADGIAEAAARMRPGFFLADPVLGDHGRLYSIADDAMITAMRRLAVAADVITPNLTEAFALLGEPYRDGPFAPGEAEALAGALSARFGADCALKGVAVGTQKMNILFRQSGDCIAETYIPVPQSYPGTGDVFAALLLGVFLHTRDLEGAFRTATRSTTAMAAHTYEKKTPPREGVLIEDFCPSLCTQCNIPTHL